MQCLDIAMGIVANCMKSYYDNILLFISLLYLLYLEFCLQGINFHISPHTKTAHTGILRCAHCHVSRIFIFSDLYCISHFFPGHSRGGVAGHYSHGRYSDGRYSGAIGLGLTDRQTDGWTNRFQQHSPRCRPMAPECRNSEHRY